ncbi:Peptidoglycan-associated lipoprotein [Neolewinella maritima]|uniref:Peptidoglycan-associated lipoprotein n=1 Tax=Neolewinella maritima TaxID=1383882 RepID=A0ABN8F6G1_9BACT|nr:OmpA family protein [Neolewinella maritima]CAH1000210.1 Peptidoglycan-associated lipoprotein [Neolewinella maritima]
MKALPLLLLVLTLVGCNKAKVTELETKLNSAERENALIRSQLENVQRTNGDLLNRMEDLSVISKEGATSIRESIKGFSSQTERVNELNRSIQRKDSLNLALVRNLKRSLDNINDEDVQVDVRGGKVFVSISDRLLFASGASTLNPASSEVLDKVSQVLNDHRNIDVIVEGHTDNVPVNSRSVKDNWELSTMRAASVVRQLVNEFGVDGFRLTAAGRADNDPRGDNNTPEGRAMNRRTEIVITPALDEFFNLAQDSAQAG